MAHFYCGKLTALDFSIDEWNEAWEYCLEKGITDTEEGRKILNQEYYPCDEQCFNCMAEVGARRLKTKNLKYI